jgi:predicted Zn-dependent peptidase
MEEFIINNLSNGIRWVHMPRASKLAHIALMIDAGTRDEYEGEDGLAHFIEHAIFKGTSKRKAYHILSALDRVGGELNAYTSKEDTCFHASFLSQYFSRAADIISDIAFYPSFPEKEVEKEKDVIIDEIQSYNDSPGELIFDAFEENIFKGHPLGKNVLGSEESVKQLKIEQAKNFMTRHYGVNKMVICTAGALSVNKMKSTLERFFGEFTQTSEKRKRVELAMNEGVFTLKQDRETHQAHTIMGARAYNITEPKKLPLSLLNNYLGGPGLNSVFNLEIRERNGIAYNIESSYQPFTDNGYWQVYLGTDTNQLEKSMKLVRGILKRMRTKKLGVLQLHLAKKQYLGQMALSQESALNSMMALGKSLLLFDNIESDEVFYNRIKSISDSDILEVANEILVDENLSTLIYY